MKNRIILIASLFVMGVSLGGFGAWVANYIISDGNYTPVVVAKAESVIAEIEYEKQLKELAERKEAAAQSSETPKKSTNGRVTDPSRFCSVPGCGRALFVTYNDVDYCTEHYGIAKNADIASRAAEKAEKEQQENGEGSSNN